MEQAIVSGLILGCIYALVAQGYYITHITTNTLNFGQGDFLMLGAMVGLSSLGMTLPFLPAWLAFLIAVAVVVLLQAVLGMALERVAIRPLKSFVSISWILSTVAVSIIVRNLAMIIWGKPTLPFASPFGDKVVRIGSVGILPHEIFIVICAVVVMAVLMLGLNRTTFGKGLRAVALNPDAASLMGVNPKKMAVTAYVMSCILAGIGGLMVGPITNVVFFMGVDLGLKAFAAAILGGLGNPWGILIGGLLIGVSEQVAALYDSLAKDAAAFVLILLVLLIRPQGLFGKSVKEKY
ncbi:branched-chain amino acid ABC transporter permease [Effusibacillus lacus]|uniref:Branched-chain amino acid ABC transporter permease n=1 Tax=Effusibacillus lacus TaxID=1348429 RepID=A0A292YGE2_9BACL|nr:branched-chain amino acid ABC transporter permease [Effusibacillus lacus]TCS71857.1 amino acid/amide ABC transporter membrane protein 1 (HAAT family) [Effusibacillus lacus]GAX89577.1 branched-chain amino acid ABC transporter permease [Effusibacillus lacus]